MGKKEKIAKENIFAPSETDGSPILSEFLRLRQLESQIRQRKKNSFHSWIELWWNGYPFYDEGLAEWKCPGKEKGLWWLALPLATYDDELIILKKIPIFQKQALEALAHVLKRLIIKDWLYCKF